MHAGKLLPVLFNEIVFLDFGALDLRECPLRVGRYLVAARKFRDHPQWAECVHRVPLPTSRRPVGSYARKHPRSPGAKAAKHAHWVVLAQAPLSENRKKNWAGAGPG